MTFEEFAKDVQQMPNANDIRAEYISAFVDVENQYYKKTVSQFRQFRDGFCYEGYLWDCLKKPHERITFQNLAEMLEGLANVYVFWDIHSNELLVKPNLWKFPKPSVLRLTGSQLMHGFRFLPEDLYVCDATFTWTLITTHEEDHPDRVRLCFKIDDRARA